ncbi:MAG: clostripain-related cysteine peptidase [Armatimonadota bacterium]|nr:clostripain-related cysteine peptidase [Armatimonadota bacterium]MCX7777357.1 clostripain-related cysteine peptidase [Armatimonadota bacterium]MDW8025375.1 clostripain-related cysteine peptidase [Armatimonadota bacterium]
MLTAAWLHTLLGGWLFELAAQPSKWTVMVYMCGDNDLESALIKDLNEMEKIGSTNDVRIVAQLSRSPLYDTSNNNWVGVRRYFVTRDPYEDPSPDVLPNNTIRSQVLSEMGMLNMGTKKALVDFVTWAVANYPAERYFLILSDHGSGVRPFERGLLRRAIIFSDSFNDHLSNRELKEAFLELRRGILNEKPLEILGYDASEMSMIENAYQVRHAAKYLIASQLSEPNDGYPYDRFLSDLTSNPNISTEDFLHRFVKHYITSYEPGRPTNGAGSSVTIAVYRLNALQKLISAISDLSVKLRQRLSSYASLIEELRRMTQSFSEHIYRDLYHFCELLIQRFPDEEVKDAARNVIKAHGPNGSGALFAEAHRTGFDINVDNAHGIAIYFPPTEGFEPGYLTDLDFGRDCEWGRFLAARSGTDLLPPTIRFLIPAADGVKLHLTYPMLIVEVRDDGYAGLNEASISVSVDGAKLGSGEIYYDAQTALLKVKPKAPLNPGRHSITVSAKDNFDNSASSSISFEVVPYKISRGIRMLSLPMATASHDPRVVLNDDSAMLARWDNAASAYRIFPAADRDGYASFRPKNIGVNSPPAGVGYFVRLKGDVTVLHAGEPIDPSQPYDVSLPMDGTNISWHMLGNPFPVPVRLSSIFAIHNGVKMTLEDALAKGIVLSPPFIYLPSSDPFAAGRYATVGHSFELQPFSAFWIATSTDVVMRFMPPIDEVRSVERFSSALSKHLAPPASEEVWRIRLTASCAGESDSVTLVMSPLGRASHDALDVLKPPSPPNAKVRCFALQKLFGSRSAEYEVAVQQYSAYASWDIVVDANLDDVILSWEGAFEVPSSYRLTLVDVNTGKAICMRRYSFVFLPRRSEPHKLRVVAQAGAGSRASIVGLSATPNRGGLSIRFTLLTDMAVTVRLRALTGRVIATILQRSEMRKGAQALLCPIPKDVVAAVAIVEVIGEDSVGRSAMATCVARLR